MTVLLYIRAGGLLMIISGLALGYSYIPHSQHMSPDVIASSSWILIHTLFAVFLVLGLLGTTALYAVTVLRAGRLVLTGYVMLFIGMVLIFGLDYYEILITPFLAINYPAVINDHGAGNVMGMIAFAFPLSCLLTVIGCASLGTAWTRSRIVPGYLGILLILSAIAFGVGLSQVGDIEVARITATVCGAALVAVGIGAMLQNQNFNATPGKHP